MNFLSDLTNLATARDRRNKLSSRSLLAAARIGARSTARCRKSSFLATMTHHPNEADVKNVVKNVVRVTMIGLQFPDRRVKPKGKLNK